MNIEPSTYQKWTCPNCGKVDSAYWGQCLKCNATLNPIKEPYLPPTNHGKGDKDA